MRILVADDEKDIAKNLKKYFKSLNHEVFTAYDGDSALKLAESKNFDVLILDWKMPGKNADEVCNLLHKNGNKTPIIILTALRDLKNKIEGFKLGADDYVTKPFEEEELLARINAVVRRYQQAEKILKFDNITVDLITRTFKKNNSEVKLSEKEFSLLKHFLDNRGKIISKDELCKSIWNSPLEPGNNIVEATIKNLRKKIEENSNKKYIKTIYGEGYIFIEK
ncbi:MAG: response regulator transcription factor [Candidatus Lokiarchaeota archaeon]|nr:response regulator transcription factor [Candidatus Lokiarchaeota archaeon]